MIGRLTHKLQNIIQYRSFIFFHKNLMPFISNQLIYDHVFSIAIFCIRRIHEKIDLGFRKKTQPLVQS